MISLIMFNLLLDFLPKIGLVIGLIFSVLPLPLLFRAVALGSSKDLKSLSLPGTIMGLTCTSAIFAFCELKGLDDCVRGSYMGLASGIVTLMVMFGLKNDMRTFMILMVAELTLYYSVRNIMTEALTNALTLVLNTLACVLGPLDALEKVLLTKDVAYIHKTLHFLGFINGIIWALYHFHHESYPLSLANSLGIVCECFLYIGYLHA
jgi:hypothetical protein